MKRNKNFWSYRLHKLGTPSVADGQMDGQSGSITRPAFAKAMQVKKCCEDMAESGCSKNIVRAW